MVERTGQAEDEVRGRRDLTVDLLRGYFLAVMVVNHVRSFPSLFEPLTGGTRMWVSAAEGFFFLSGLVAARLRGAPMDVARRLLRRAGRLYVWSVLLTLFFTAVGRVLHDAPPMTLGISMDPPLRVLWRALALQYTYGLADMLPLYAIFLVALPVVLLALRRGFWLAVVAISLELWAIGVAWPDPLRVTHAFFSEISWQLLFVAGALVGFHWEALQARLAAWSEQARRATFRALALATGVTGYLSWLDGYARRYPLAWRPAMHVLFGRPQLGPGRAMVFSIWMAFLFAAVKMAEPRLVALLGPFLLTLGQSSLYVYIVHAIVLFPLYDRETDLFWVATLRDASVLLLLWGLTRRRVLFNVIRA